MVMLSNIDCFLFQVTTINDLHRFMAEDCGYVPQQSIIILSGIPIYWCWACIAKHADYTR